jgi:hypothetical protein
LPAQGTLHVEDAADADILAASDVRTLDVEERDGELHFRVTMAAPLSDGMFTCVHVFVDCDARPESGIDGAELWIRAAIGSRFWPNSADLGEEESAPIELRRATGSEIASGGHSDGVDWMHTIRELPKPEVEGATIRFRFPTQLIEKQTRYDSGYRFRVEVETSSSEQPLLLDHRILDRGLPIQIDGSLDEWLGGDHVSDPGSELHPSIRMLDLTSLRVDHGPGSLFLGIEFDEEGFDSRPSETDVTVFDALRVFVDTPFPRYQEPLSIRVARGERERTGDGWIAVADDERLEIGIVREDEQRRVIVHVWTDGERRDFVQGGSWLNLGGQTR